MNTHRSVLCALVCLAAVGFALAQQSETVGKIGVYDSRSIAIAYGGSEFFAEWFQDLQRRHDGAEAADEEELVAQLAAEAHAKQEQMHKQGFSTAPVDDLLEHIKNKIPEIMESHGVIALVSKWDEEGMAAHASAEKVDLTMDLVKAFDPDKRQLKGAREIMKQEPGPLEEMKEHHH
jgi:hypothetical protein